MKSKNNDNVELLEMLFKTEQFIYLKDDIVKDSFKAILSCLKNQNDKLNNIDSNLYDKISREEFNENLKNKVNFSDFMSQLNYLGEKNNRIDKRKIILPKFENEKQFNENDFSNNISLYDLNNEIKNLKIECSILSKKLENMMLIHGDPPQDKNINTITDKLEKNEKDITNLSINFQNNLIKINDTISNIKMSQINKNEINKYINEELKKIEENNIKNIEKEFSIIKQNINKHITDTFIEINKNNIKDKNNNSENNNIKMDLLLKDIFAKFNIFDDMIKEMNSKFHKKIDKEEIIDIYSNIEEIKNNTINNKNEIDKKLNELLNNLKIIHKNLNNSMGNEDIIAYQEKEIKNIKLDINENYKLLNNIKEEFKNLKKDKNNYILNEKEIKNVNGVENNCYNFNNIYPKNDIKNEISYLKRFINKFMLDTKNENRKEMNNLFNSLNEKMNINDINNILKRLENDINNKVNLDLFYKHIQIQNDINNFISKENIIGKWVSNKNTLLKNSFILWDEQLINSAPNNFCFSPNNSFILIKEKGIYLIKIILFNEYENNNPMSNIQLIIDREKEYNYSYSKTKFINKDKINNSFEESIIFEECIKNNNTTRVEIRLDGFNYSENNEIINGNSETNIYKKKDNIKAILLIKSL